MEEDSVLRLTFAGRSGLAVAIELSVDWKCSGSLQTLRQ